MILDGYKFILFKLGVMIDTPEHNILNLMLIYVTMTLIQGCRGATNLRSKNFCTKFLTYFSNDLDEIWLANH